MLFKHKHLLEELRKKGSRATGEILSMTTLGEASSLTGAFAPDEDLTKAWFDCRMVLRVVPRTARSRRSRRRSSLVSIP
jgi:hypothetical protein